MNDVFLESIRAVLVLAIFVYLIVAGQKSGIYKQSGWIQILLGFGLLVFASFIDVTDNYETLNKYVIIGDTPVQAFLEKVVGYLAGFLFLAIGFFKWIPKVVELEQTKEELLSAQQILTETNSALEAKVAERTKELEEKATGAIEDSTEMEKLNTEFQLKNEELKGLNEAMVGRELKMVELKEEIERLKSGDNDQAENTN